MCGIGGIIDFSDIIQDKQRSIVTMMLSMDHRGPDDVGYHQEGNVALGHNRLSIIDVEGGKQPIYNEDRSLVIVFNGEIYNFQDLRKNLLQRGHRFATETDTEVIIHAYEDYGERAVEHLRGMFAFAIWDSKNQRLFIARDRVGIKPLYFINHSSFFCFASELKAFFVAGLHQPAVNVQALDSYLSLNYVLGPETAFKGIHKLLPGHSLTVGTHEKLTVKRYWDFDAIRPTDHSAEHYIDHFNHLFKETVGLHMLSEVPLGAFLSGGIDSSLTVGIMSQLSAKPVKTFTVGYEGFPEVSEFKYARTIADHFKTDHHELILSPAKFSASVPDVIWHLDEPLAEYATIPLMLLSQISKNHVTVMLSGEGADELFAGYTIYYIMSLIEKYRKVPKLFRSIVTDPLLKFLLAGKREGKYLDWLSLDLERRYIGNGSYLTDGIKQKLYSPDFREKVNCNAIYDVVGEYYSRLPAGHTLQKMLYMDTKTWLPDDLLLKADKMTMAHSIELRVPFLDHKLLEFAASLPPQMKMNGSTPKFILKKAAKGFLPKEIINRKKKGFPVPMKQWLEKDLLPIARETLLEGRSRQRGYFNTPFIEKMLESHAAAADNLNVTIWNLYSLELWHRIFIDGQSEIVSRKRIVENKYLSLKDNLGQKS